jgi:hypothetical protein
VREGTTKVLKTWGRACTSRWKHCPQLGWTMPHVLPNSDSLNSPSGRWLVEPPASRQVARLEQLVLQMQNRPCKAKVAARASCWKRQQSGKGHASANKSGFPSQLAPTDSNSMQQQQQPPSNGNAYTLATHCSKHDAGSTDFNPAHTVELCCTTLSSYANILSASLSLK